MISQIRRPIYTFFGIAAMSVALSGCIIHVNAKDADWDDGYSSSWESKGQQSDSAGNIKSTNKSVRVAEGREVNNVSSVNGGVRIKDKVKAKEVSSVNGAVVVGDYVAVESLESVNGAIKVGSHFSSTGNVTTVNGGIRIDENSSVKGKVQTVNGSVNLENVDVGKDVTSKNGDITITEGSVIKGDIHFEEVRNNSFFNKKSKAPTLFISEDSTVEGAIILDREVILKLENEALMNKVQKNY
jgi:hypothetical protein